MLSTYLLLAGVLCILIALAGGPATGTAVLFGVFFAISALVLHGQGE